MNANQTSTYKRIFNILLIPIFLLDAFILTKISSGVIQLGRLPKIEDCIATPSISIFSKHTEEYFLMIIFFLSIICLLALIPVSINLGEKEKVNGDKWLFLTIALIAFQVILFFSPSWQYAVFLI